MKGQIVILAGGLGKRLRPATNTVPKPMIPVAGKPFLYWQLLDLQKQGCQRVLLLISYLGQQIRDFFGTGAQMGLQIAYSAEPEPMGTGGAVAWGIDHLDSEFLLLNGDSFLHAPVNEMFTQFIESPYDAMISSYYDSSTTPVPANIHVDNSTIIAYQKDAGIGNGFSLVDSGIYAFRRSLFSGRKQSTFNIEALWPELILQRRLGHFPVHEKFYDIGTPKRIRTFEEKIHDYF